MIAVRVDPTILSRMVYIYVIADIDIGMDIHTSMYIRRSAKIMIAEIPAAAIDGGPGLLSRPGLGS
jgi:hypothetical protein